MWPWGHLAVGYLLYSSLARVRYGRPPSGGEAIALAFGTQLPDLVDKPLAWGLGVLPGGRTLGHSLLTLAVVVSIVYAYWRYRGRPERGVAFGVGALSHPFADGLLALVQGHTQYVGYFFWPLFGRPEYDTEAIVLTEAAGLEFTLYGFFQLGLVVLALVVWLSDGRPGLDTGRRLVGDDPERDPNLDR